MKTIEGQSKTSSLPRLRIQVLGLQRQVIGSYCIVAAFLCIERIGILQ